MGGWKEGSNEGREKGWERGKKEEMKVAGVYTDGRMGGHTDGCGCVQEWTGSPAVLPMWTLGESLLSEPRQDHMENGISPPRLCSPRPSHSPRAHRCP